ncbi:hypothetical protein [Massilia aerilata]|uniref:Integrase n=1 Tax=Massilia aerilata TaxID=453817 RepID=A0ABW0S5Y9_9BURK
MQDDYAVKEIVEPYSGKVHRLYTYKKKPCRRILLRSRLCDQLAGYTLIEKDLRSVIVWLSEIEKLQAKWPLPKGARAWKSPDRDTYNIVKGLFVAALTFYGKCFSKCEGRPVKLERAQLTTSFHAAHDRCIRFRHNFAAHSGAERLEYVEIALVFPIKIKRPLAPKLYTELFQPDMALPVPGDITLIELVEHVRLIAIKKIQNLHQKIIGEEVLPKGRDYWMNK